MNIREKPCVLVFTTSYFPFVGGVEIAIKEVIRRNVVSYSFFIITARVRRNLPKREFYEGGTIIRVGFGVFLDKWFLPFLSTYMAWKIKRTHTHAPLLIWGLDISQGSIGATITKWLFPHIPFLLTLQYGEGNIRLEKGRKGFIRLAFHWMLAWADQVSAISFYLIEIARKYDYCGKIHLIP
ncbi:MAG: hypothetical protein G01um101466_190, partial [Parcubacteria group bacterium Gr01-1014_66]